MITLFQEFFKTIHLVFLITYHQDNGPKYTQDILIHTSASNITLIAHNIVSRDLARVNSYLANIYFQNWDAKYMSYFSAFYLQK